MPIPKNMAEIVQKIQEERLRDVDEANLPLPVDPRTPPIKEPVPVPFEKLDNEKKNQLRAALQRQVELEKEQALDAAGDSVIANMPQGVQEAYRLASTPSPRFEDLEIDTEAGKPAPKPTTKSTVVVDNSPDIEDPVSPPPTTKTPTPDTKKVTETGVGGVGHTHCPHCNWNLSMPDVVEPPYAKKMSFLYSILGQKCYVDEMELFGGSVVVTFRALTTREIDVIYKQAYRDREMGRAQTEADYWERINRYRLFLQLVGLRSTTPETGFVHNLPDGLSADTNSLATTFWQTDTTPPPPNGETILADIEDKIVKTVLRTEALFRVVNASCNQFNRMIAKLEAMVDNSDFWKPTGAQS